MKITDYPRIKNLTKDQVLLIDGETGTKQIAIEDFPFALHDASSWVMHRNIFRGKNLGTEVTQEQKAAIASGKFTDLWVGDYWIIGGVVWRIADINYWYPMVYTQHLIIVPDGILYTASMNPTATASTGYSGSEMRKTGLEEAKKKIKLAFPNLVLPHDELLVSAINAKGQAAASVWAKNTEVELMSEYMLTGGNFAAAMTNGDIDVQSHTNLLSQLALFRLNPGLIHGVKREGIWLRDAASQKSFVYLGPTFYTSYGVPTVGLGVRPVFAIGGV